MQKEQKIIIIIIIIVNNYLRYTMRCIFECHLSSFRHSQTYYGTVVDSLSNLQKLRVLRARFLLRYCFGFPCVSVQINNLENRFHRKKSSTKRNSAGMVGLTSSVTPISFTRHSHFEFESQSQMLLTDPKVVDKMMADELNSLSFDDREALSEEIHGVRSLAPIETPEMIHNALLDLKKEIETRLTVALSSLPSSQSYLHRGNGDDNFVVNRREYLGELLVASKSLTSSSYFPSSDDAKYCSSNLSTKMSTSMGETSIPSKSDVFNPTITTSSNTTHNNNNNKKYSYAISREFRIKFLRAELFDVKKAAARYLVCIDFLVDYFGVVALQRPLYLKDLDKDEQKLLREGRCQLMPSRDRFGRRIIVFFGALGNSQSHRNRVRNTHTHTCVRHE